MLNSSINQVKRKYLEKMVFLGFKLGPQEMKGERRRWILSAMENLQNDNKLLLLIVQINNQGEHKVICSKWNIILQIRNEWRKSRKPIFPHWLKQQEWAIRYFKYNVQFWSIVLEYSFGVQFWSIVLEYSFGSTVLEYSFGVQFLEYSWA